MVHDVEEDQRCISALKQLCKLVTTNKGAIGFVTCRQVLANKYIVEYFTERGRADFSPILRNSLQGGPSNNSGPFINHFAQMGYFGIWDNQAHCKTQCCVFPSLLKPSKYGWIWI